jgi:hypothetical protein
MAALLTILPAMVGYVYKNEEKNVVKYLISIGTVGELLTIGIIVFLGLIVLDLAGSKAAAIFLG